MESTTETSSDESDTNKKSKFCCNYDDCKATFSKNRKLINHVRRHTGERPFVCNEPNCNKAYTNSSHLLRHKKFYHEKHQERIACNVEGCHRELANKWCLKKHYNRCHNPERKYPFACDVCQQGFFKKKHLQQHGYLHSGELPFACDECSAKFATHRECVRHKRTHTKYPCECGDVFERWTMLLRHRKICKNGNFSCSTCEEKFADKTSLTTHLETHKSKEDKNVFLCTYENCTRFYLHKKNLLHHIKSFHEKIPQPKIPCTYDGCNKLFSKMQNYKLHMARHKEPKKPKTERKPRKDRNTFKKSALSVICGITLPIEVEKNIIRGEIVNLHEDVYKSTVAQQTVVS